MAGKGDNHTYDPVGRWTLEEYQKRFRELLDNGINVIYSLNFKTQKYDYVSKSIKNILGYSAEEIMSLSLEQSLGQFHPEDLKVIQEQTEDALGYARRHGGCCEKVTEYRRKRKDGTWCWVRDCWTLYVDDAGEIERVAGSAYDISAQKKAEHQARRSDEFLQQCVNALEDPFFIKDQNHRWVMLNDIGFQMIGGTAEQIVGKTDYDYFPKEQADVFWQRDDHVLRTGITDVNEEEITWHGKKHYIATKKSRYVDPNTGERFITGTIRDITPRREMEEQLREKEALFMEALGASQQILYRLNFETGKYDYLSESVREMTGYDPEVLRNRGPEAAMELIHPDDWTEINRRMEAAQRKRKNNVSKVHLEYRHRNKNGQYRWFSDWGTLVYDNEGNLLRGIGAVLDITERKEMEEQLREKEAQFTEALNTGQQILYRINFAEDRYDYISDSVKTFSGYDSSEVLSHPIDFMHSRIHPEDWSDINQQLTEAQRSRKNDQSMLNLEYRFKTKSGTYRWFSDSVTMMYDPQDNLLRGVGAVMDITDRKELEQSLLAMHDQLEEQVQVRTAQLTESERKYRMLAEHITDVIALFTLEDTIEYVSPSWERVTGWTVEETIGQPAMKFTLPEEHEALAAQFSKIMEQGTIEGLRYRLKKKDGSTFWVETTARLIRDEDGHPYRMLVSTRDISERIKIENFILLQRDLSVQLNAVETPQEAFEIILDAIMEIEGIDISGIYLANETALDIAAYRNLSPGFLSEFSSIPLDHPAMQATTNGETISGDARQYFQASRMVEQEEYKAFCIAPIMHGETYLGTLNVASRTQTAIERHEINAIEAIGSQVGSVIQRTRFASALRESEETARVLLDAIQDVVILLDTEGKVITSNAAAAKSMGYENQDLSGYNFSDLISDKQVAAGRMEKYRQAVDAKQVLSFEDTRDNRIFENHIYPVQDPEGNIFRVAIFARDVTQQRKAQQQLRQYQDRIRRVEQLASIGTLSATLAHELNQPLTVIQLYLQQSLRHLKNKPRQLKTAMDKLSYSLTEVTRADDIIKHFRDFAHKSEIDRTQTVHLNDIAKRLVTALQEMTRARNIKLKLHIEKNDLTYEASPSDIEQILFVLIQNSIQAAEDRKSALIDIHLKREKQQLLLQVSDNCGGIDDELYPRIFEPFFTTKPPQKGTGLGLSILERIAQKYGAKIKTQNLSGQGMTFSIYFP